MQSNLCVFEKYFDATLEQVIEVMEKYLDKLSLLSPEAGLSVTVEEENGKKVWKGALMEIKEWGKPDIDYGYIEVTPAFFNSDTPVRVRLYSSGPRFTSYWGGVAATLTKLLIVSDGSPGPTNEPWNLVEDKSYHRKMLKLWHEGLTAREIGRRLDLAQSTVYEQLKILRKKYKTDIVPYKHPSRKNTSIP
jgi:hypothetical protein